MKNRTRMLLALLSLAYVLTNSSLGSDTPAVSGTSRVAGHIDQILRQVEAATRPPKGYSAAVHQTVTKTSGAATRSSLAGQAELLAEEDYAVNCTDDGATHATALLSSTRAREKAPAAAGPDVAQMRGGLMTANPLMLLRHVAAMASPEIADDLYQGVPCHKISAQDAHYGFVLWVSKAAPSVRRVVVQVGPIVMYDTTFEYAHWHGSLVPSHVEITTPSTGTKVVHDYSGQTF